MVAVTGGILTLTLSKAFQRAITEKLYGYFGGAWIRSFGQELESTPRPLLRASIDSLRIPEARLEVAVHLPVLIEAPGMPYEGAEVLAVEQSWFQDHWHKALRGPLPPRWEGPIIILSERLANRLGVRVGDDVTMAWLSDPPRFRKLRVVALYHSGLEEVDARMAFVPLPLGQALRRYEAHYIQVAHVFIQDPQALGPIIERLQEALTVEEEIVPIEYLFSDIFDWLGLIRQNVGLILGIVVGMSFFVATAAFLVLLLVQRSRFQLLRVLGMGKRAIWGLVLGQALVAVGLGVVGGALLSFILLLSQSVWGWAQLDPESYLLEQVPVYWDGTAFALVSLGALGLALIMGWWAAPGAIDSEHRLSEIVS